MANGCAFDSCITTISAFPFSELLPDDFPNLEPTWELGCKRHDSACSWRYCQLSLNAHDRANVNPSLADFLEGDGIAQVVIGWLLDMIDNLPDELETAKWAQQDVETHLIWATHKHPTSPCHDDVDDTIRQQKCKHGTDDGGVLATQPPEVPKYSQKTCPHPQWVQEPLELATELAPHDPHIEITLKEDEATEPPPPKASTRKSRRGEGQILVPTTYVMPTSLPRAATPPINMSPKQLMLSETIEGLSTDNKWKQDLCRYPVLMPTSHPIACIYK